jgi:hypothetical protein
MPAPFAVVTNRPAPLLLLLLLAIDRVPEPIGGEVGAMGAKKGEAS